jgi:hypothetical protein
MRPQSARQQRHTVHQCCPAFLYIGAHLTDGCGGAGAVWRLQQNKNNNNKVILIVILIEIIRDFIFYYSIS